MTPTTKKTKLYLKPAIFFDETLSSLRDDKMSNKLGIMFQLLSTKYNNSHMFVRYSHVREDMIATGVLACVKGFDKFEPYNKLGLAIKNGLLEQSDEDPSVFSYSDSGETITFHFQDIKQHKQPITKMLQEFEKSNDLEGWDGEILEYDHKICNNPFAFFTTCIHNSLLLFLKKEYQERNIFNKIKIQEGLEADFGYLEMVRKKDEEGLVSNPREDEDNTHLDLIQWEED